MKKLLIVSDEELDVKVVNRKDVNHGLCGYRCDKIIVDEALKLNEKQLINIWSSLDYHKFTSQARNDVPFQYFYMHK